MVACEDDMRRKALRFSALRGLCLRVVVSSSLVFANHFASAQNVDGPDDTDRSALAALRAEVEFKAKQNAETPLEDVLNHLTETVRKTQFTPLGTAPCESCRRTLAGTGARPEGVSEDEWQALQTTAMPNDVGLGPGPLMVLVDLDGDGLRDLTVEDPLGMATTSVVSSFRRVGDHFEWRGEWYLTESRSANQTQWLVRLEGRVYTAFRDGAFGVDQLYLLRPFHMPSRLPRLSVKYRYLLEVPAIQRVDGIDGNNAFRYERMDSALHIALNEAVAANTPLTPAGDAPLPEHICPLPAGLLDEHEFLYFTFGTAYYANETLIDFPIMVGNDCYIGRLTDHHGAYDRMLGLFAFVQMRRPESLHDRSYEVMGRREVIGVDSGVAPSISWFKPDDAFK